MLREDKANSGIHEEFCLNCGFPFCPGDKLYVDNNDDVFCTRSCAIEYYKYIAHRHNGQKHSPEDCNTRSRQMILVDNLLWCPDCQGWAGKPYPDSDDDETVKALRQHGVTVDILPDGSYTVIPFAGTGGYTGLSNDDLRAFAWGFFAD